MSGKKIDINVLTEYVGKCKSDHYKLQSKILCDQNSKTSCMLQYSNLKIYVRNSMVVEKFHKTVSFKQSFWLKK